MTWPAELRTHWFGASWGAPVNEDCPETPVPVGVKCLRCHERIKADDRGQMMPLMLQGPRPELAEYIEFLPHTGTIPWCAHHLACQMEEILGPRWREVLTDWGMTIET